MQANTGYNADSCEFCPEEERLLAVGTYQLDESNTRVGKLLLYNVVDGK